MTICIQPTIKLTVCESTIGVRCFCWVTGFSEHKFSIRCAIEETLNCRVSPNQVPDANQENQHSIIDSCIKDRTCFLEKALELSKSLNGSGSTESAFKSGFLAHSKDVALHWSSEGNEEEIANLTNYQWTMCNNVQNLTRLQRKCAHFFLHLPEVILLNRVQVFQHHFVLLSRCQSHCTL